ncbi:MAG: ATP-binding protein [Methanofollis sp.]|uniref:AAA family ATPase n=1 Tax=Methanofollis sp. TaxID=2052835 RepID=UPI002615515B|nr:ATP-binding protein [Methanofollis sp.]MDD4256078.1 ATP-binding protein [Methanofollis sp.]
MDENPFVFGQPVRGPAFIDRTAELERVRNYLKNGRSLIIYSPRKYGKTSLVLRAIDGFGGSVLPIFLDCYAFTSEHDLARALSAKVLAHYPEREILAAIKRLFAGITPEITVKTAPEVEVGVEYEPEEDLSGAYDLPERLAVDRGRRVVVVFDEFQELAGFENLLKTLRSVFQHHQHVAYVFIGSKRHMMEWIFRSQESPFYNFGAHMTLHEIPAGAFAAYIGEAFAGAGIALLDGTVEALLAATGCHPHYTQRLAFEVWYRGRIRGSAGPADVEAAIREVIADLEGSYLAIWDALTANQRRVLLAVAQGEDDLFSGEFARTRGFASPASVQSALRRILERGIAEEEGGGYRVADPFLARWMEGRFLRG